MLRQGFHKITKKDVGIKAKRNVFPFLEKG